MTVATPSSSLRRRSAASWARDAKVQPSGGVEALRERRQGDQGLGGVHGVAEGLHHVDAAVRCAQLVQGRASRPLEDRVARDVPLDVAAGVRERRAEVDRRGEEHLEGPELRRRRRRADPRLDRVKHPVPRAVLHREQRAVLVGDRRCVQLGERLGRAVVEAHRVPHVGPVARPVASQEQDLAVAGATEPLDAVPRCCLALVTLPFEASGPR